MYYYILEQPKNGNAISMQKKIQGFLDFYGISGEISRVSPARSIEELTEIALAKQYSTIVAVGSDDLINRMLSLVQDRDCTFGIIPINASPLVNELIGTDDIKKACLALKERKVKILDLAYILPDKYFLTKAEIINRKPALGTIYFDKCNANIRFTKTTIYSPTITGDEKLHIDVDTIDDKSSGLAKTFNWLIGSNKQSITKSCFQTKHFIVDTPEPMAITVNGKVIAKTPIEVKTKLQGLKIITSRVKIEPDKQ